MSELFLRPLFTWRSALASIAGPQSPVTRHVLLTLSLHMSELGDSCYPSLATLARETGLALSTVKAHIGFGVAAGWIGKRERRRRPNTQGWRGVEYFAQIPAEAEALFHDKQGGPAPGPRQRGASPGPAQRGPRHAERGPSDGPNVVRHAAPSTSRSTSGKEMAPAAGRRTLLPEGFAISDQVRQWAAKYGYGKYLELHLAHFVDYAKANRKLYEDWDAAFRNCIRGDWGGIRKQAMGGRGPEPVASATHPCGNCTAPLTGGWTQSPKGRVCTPCYRAYLDGGWPVARPAGAMDARAAA